jgi:hypothetical protein
MGRKILFTEEQFNGLIKELTAGTALSARDRAIRDVQSERGWEIGDNTEKRLNQIEKFRSYILDTVRKFNDTKVYLVTRDDKYGDPKFYEGKISGAKKIDDKRYNFVFDGKNRFVDGDTLTKFPLILIFKYYRMTSDKHSEYDVVWTTTDGNDVTINFSNKKARAAMASLANKEGDDEFYKENFINDLATIISESIQTVLNEGRNKSYGGLEWLKKHQIEMTPEEKEYFKSKGLTWPHLKELVIHKGKAKDEKDGEVYFAYTHRAWGAKPTKSEAVKMGKFIMSTS